MRVTLNDRDLAIVRHWYDDAKRRRRRGPMPGSQLAQQLGFEEKKDAPSAAAAG